MSSFPKNIFEEAAAIVQAALSPKIATDLGNKLNSKVGKPQLAEQDKAGQEKDDQVRWQAIQQHYSQMQNELDQLYHLTDKTPAEVKRLLNEPHRFSSEQKRALQETKETIDRHIQGALGAKFKEFEKQEKNKHLSERRKKFVGSRKKWLPIN